MFSKIALQNILVNIVTAVTANEYRTELKSLCFLLLRQIAPSQDNIRDVDQILTDLINVQWPRLVEEVETKCAIWESRIQTTRQRLSELLKSSANNHVHRQHGLVSVHPLYYVQHIQTTYTLWQG